MESDGILVGEPLSCHLLTTNACGFECKVLKCAVDSLSRFKPTMIVEFGEYTLKENNSRLEELIDLLWSCSYTLYSEKDRKHYVSKKSLLSDIPHGRTINVLCIHN